MSNIIVTPENLDAVFFEIQCHGIISLDTETTGLNPYKGDRIFSVIISTYKDNFYFNFNDKPDHLGNYCPVPSSVLDRRVLRRFRPILDNPDTLIYIHNASFDMHFFNVEKINVRFRAKIFCTKAHGRLVHNQLQNYKLETLGAAIGIEKDNALEKYISKHKLYTLVDVGKKKPRKDKHYDLVPWEIITEYGFQDGRVCFELGRYEEARLQEIDKEVS